MTHGLTKLIEIAAPARAHSDPVASLRADARLTSPLGQELLDMLDRKNGYVAFEEALEVYPVDSAAYPNLAAWNAPDGWRGEYEVLPDDLVFFAQDVFGVQFYLNGTEVGTFDPETGTTTAMCGSLEEWAQLILADYEMLTGYPLAHDWQTQHGALPPGTRLVPKIPFVLGGGFSLDNLYTLDCTQSMVLRASIANQIRNLPDGASVQIEIVD